MSEPKPKQDEPIKRMLAPVRLEFTVSAGRDKTAFLGAIIEGRILGGRCPSCRKVYVPPRGCPTCGVEMVGDIPISDHGVVTTFCTVSIPFEGQTMKLPYVYASIVLDGADVPIFHLVDGIDAKDARMGLRVRADWRPPAERKPTMESIRAFVPTGEPDAAFDTYKEHL